MHSKEQAQGQQTRTGQSNLAHPAHTTRQLCKLHQSLHQAVGHACAAAAAGESTRLTTRLLQGSAGTLQVAGLVSRHALQGCCPLPPQLCMYHCSCWHSADWPCCPNLHMCQLGVSTRLQCLLPTSQPVHVQELLLLAGSRRGAAQHAVCLVLPVLHLKWRLLIPARAYQGPGARVSCLL